MHSFLNTGLPGAVPALRSHATTRSLSATGKKKKRKEKRRKDIYTSHHLSYCKGFLLRSAEALEASHEGRFGNSAVSVKHLWFEAPHRESKTLHFHEGRDAVLETASFDQF
jgi:hypothetical protein